MKRGTGENGAPGRGTPGGRCLEGSSWRCLALAGGSGQAPVSTSRGEATSVPLTHEVRGPSWGPCALGRPFQSQARGAVPPGLWAQTRRRGWLAADPTSLGWPRNSTAEHPSSLGLPAPKPLPFAAAAFSPRNPKEKEAGVDHVACTRGCDHRPPAAGAPQRPLIPAARGGCVVGWGDTAGSGVVLPSGTLRLSLPRGVLAQPRVRADDNFAESTFVFSCSQHFQSRRPARRSASTGPGPPGRGPGCGPTVPGQRVTELSRRIWEPRASLS